MRRNTIQGLALGTGLTVATIGGAGLIYENGAHIGEVGVDGHLPAVVRELGSVMCQIRDVGAATREHPYTGAYDCEKKTAPGSTPADNQRPNQFVDPHTPKDDWITNPKSRAGVIAIRDLRVRAHKLTEEASDSRRAAETDGTLLLVGGAASIGPLAMLLASRGDAGDARTDKSAGKPVPRPARPAPGEPYPDEVLTTVKQNLKDKRRNR